jgi:hypothetical protein
MTKKLKMTGLTSRPSIRAIIDGAKVIETIIYSLDTEDWYTVIVDFSRCEC